VAIEKTVKGAVHAEETEFYQRLNKRELFQGMSKSYAPNNDDGEKLPSETKKVQYTVADGLASIMPAIKRLCSVVFEKETANTQAKADVVVDGVVILKDAPVTYLLFLQKQLENLRTIVSKLPTLPPDETWTADEVGGLWKTQPHQQARTKKVNKPLTLSAATDKHPAQVHLVTEDVQVGFYTTVQYSGEASPKWVKATQAKISALAQAVQYARESANSGQVTESKGVTDKVVDFIFA
jgi:hypothetical protein